MKNRWVTYQKRSLAQRGRRHAGAGFTLIEMLIVVAIAGILMTMSGPIWLGLLSSHSLSTAQSQAYQMLQSAQGSADQTRTGWQASFRSVNNGVEAAVHPVDRAPSTWELLSRGVQIDPVETTLLLSNGVYHVQFNQNGRVNGQLGRITFSSSAAGSARRCVIVSTLLGTLRRGQNQTTPDAAGRYCY